MGEEMIAAFTNELVKIAGNVGAFSVKPSAIPMAAKPSTKITQPQTKPTNYSVVNSAVGASGGTAMGSKMTAPPPVRT